LALASTMEEPLTALLPLSRLHASPQEQAATWSALEEIGVFGISVGAEQGGSGLGATEEALIVMTLGRCLAAPGVLATLGAGHASVRQTSTALRGRRVAAAYRRGSRIILAQDTAADLVLLRDCNDAAL